MKMVYMIAQKVGKKWEVSTANPVYKTKKTAQKRKKYLENKFKGTTLSIRKAKVIR